MKAVFAIFFLIAACALGSLFFPSGKPASAELPFQPVYEKTVLLLPLDSRPACVGFVQSLGDIAGIRVLTPPEGILDHYKKAGDVKALRQWCRQNAGNADAAIISIDMLIHGGLLASRHANAAPEDIAEALGLLEELRLNHPALPVYAFHILPRLWPADNEENNKYQKEILAYSKLSDQIYTFENPRDIKKLEKISAKVPAEVLDNYRRVYQENLALNKKLVDMAAAGILEQLVIGQDDSESFGIPNLAKRQLLHYIKQKGIDENRVFVTKGADEIAMTLLGNIHGRFENARPKIYVHYADEGIPSIVMPYMASSIRTTVKEKIALVNGTAVKTPEKADFILFVYVGSDRNVGYQYVVNQEIQSLLEANHNVALVDLSEHFAPDETILPVLMQNSARINQLIAYSGWNTASNSIGTAIAQAAIFTAERKKAAFPAELFTLYRQNLKFLTNRFLEDYFYLKESIDAINKNLKKENTDVYDFKERRLWANTILKAEMIQKTLSFKNSVSFNRPVKITEGNQVTEAKLTGLSAVVSYPWERTFEIKINSDLKLEKSY